jgi:hypothetical protein
MERNEIVLNKTRPSICINHQPTCHRLKNVPVAHWGFHFKFQLSCIIPNKGNPSKGQRILYVCNILIIAEATGVNFTCTNAFE